MYHGSELSSHAYETVNLTTGAVTPVPLSGTSFGEFRAMTERDAGSFYLSDGGNLFTISTGGAVAFVAPLAHTFGKGMVLVPVPEPATVLLAGAGALAVAALLRRLGRDTAVDVR